MELITDLFSGPRRAVSLMCVHVLSLCVRTIIFERWWIGALLLPSVLNMAAMDRVIVRNECSAWLYVR